jgi:hypothetical protein
VRKVEKGRPVTQMDFPELMRKTMAGLVKDAQAGSLKLGEKS